MLPSFSSASDSRFSYSLSLPRDLQHAGHSQWLLGSRLRVETMLTTHQSRKEKSREY